MFPVSLLDSRHLLWLYIEALEEGWLDAVTEIDSTLSRAGKPALLPLEDSMVHSLKSCNYNLWAYIFDKLPAAKQQTFAPKMLAQLPHLPSHFAPAVVELLERHDISLEKLLDLSIQKGDAPIALMCLQLDHELNDTLKQYASSKFIETLKVHTA